MPVPVFASSKHTESSSLGGSVFLTDFWHQIVPADVCLRRIEHSLSLKL